MPQKVADSTVISGILDKAENIGSRLTGSVNAVEQKLNALLDRSALQQNLKEGVKVAVAQDFTTAVHEKLDYAHSQLDRLEKLLSHFSEII